MVAVCRPTWSTTIDSVGPAEGRFAVRWGTQSEPERFSTEGREKARTQMVRMPKQRKKRVRDGLLFAMVGRLCMPPGRSGCWSLLDRGSAVLDRHLRNVTDSLPIARCWRGEHTRQGLRAEADRKSVV